MKTIEIKHKNLTDEELYKALKDIDNKSEAYMNPGRMEKKTIKTIKKRREGLE